MPDPVPRIPQIAEAERTDEVRAMFAAIAGAGTDDVEDHYVLKTFAQHPALTKPFLDFNLHLLTTSTLPVRLRQIAILRVAWEKRARYMWASHVRLSLRVGLVEADFEAAKLGLASPHWSDAERAIVRATDELMTRSDVDDAMWAELSAHLERKQIMDLLFTVGAYVLLALAFNAMRIQREPELIALAERYGSPA
jgi:alkylhydroperoxidase family enzyme